MLLFKNLRLNNLLYTSLQSIYSSYTTEAKSAVPDFRPIIGLEVHAQIATKTKLFSESASTDVSTSIDANSLVDIFDSSIPGTLPRLSRSCIEKSLLTAVLLNCELADFCRFDRKHYFYPDLPLGYQITQKWNPMARNGYFDFYVQPIKEDNSHSFLKRVSIQQIQLEMDSGKTLRHGKVDLLDLNRAGLALIEIVTAPEFCSPAEAVSFVEQLRIALIHNGVCSGNFHEGNLRIDANISISKAVGIEKEEQKSLRVELKNLSGNEHLFDALTKEISRQKELLMAGNFVEAETRAVDTQGRTFSARTKGEKLDYRFIPETNLPPMRIHTDWIEKAKRQVKRDFPHLFYILKAGFSPLFTFEVLRDKRLERLVQVYLQQGPPLPFQQFLEWLNELEFICKNASCNFPPSSTSLLCHFAEIVHLNWQGRLTKLVGIDLMRELASADEIERENCGSLSQLIEKRNLWRITDPKVIAKLVDEVMGEQAAKDFLLQRLIEQRTKPRSKAMGKLKKEIILRSGKRASPEDVELAIWGRCEREEEEEERRRRRGASREAEN